MYVNKKLAFGSECLTSRHPRHTDKVKPNRLQYILFTGTGKKGDNYKFGPVVANSIKIWKTVERRIGGPFKFCNSTPLWHNFNFICGNHPFVQPPCLL